MSVFVLALPACVNADSCAFALRALSRLPEQRVELIARSVFVGTVVVEAVLAISALHRSGSASAAPMREPIVFHFHLDYDLSSILTCLIQACGAMIVSTLLLVHKALTVCIGLLMGMPWTVTVLYGLGALVYIAD